MRVIASVAIACAASVTAARIHAAEIDVVVRLTDLEYAPIAGAPMRVVAGRGRAPLAASTGVAATTNAKGEIVVHLDGPVETDAGSKRDDSTRVPIAIEVPYGAQRWRFAFDLVRAPAGDASVESLAIVAADASGAFTRALVREPDGWRVPDDARTLLTLPGYLPWHVSLSPPDARHAAWRAEVGMAKAPETPLR